MTIFSIRPVGMACKNNVYYPAGFPYPSESAKTYHMVEYKDPDYRSFWICYTESQAERLIKENGVFAPYIPFTFFKNKEELTGSD